MLKSIILLSSSAAASQIVTLLCMPLITRIYTPESFGILSIYTSISITLIPICTLSLPLTISLPHDENETQELIYGCINILIKTCFLTIIFIIITKSIYPEIQNENINSYIYLIPLTVFIYGINSIFNNINIRKNNNKHRANAGIIQSITLNSSRLLLNQIPLKLEYLIISYTIAPLLAIIYLRNSQPYKVFKPKLINSVKLKILYRKYKSTIKYRTTQVTLYSLNQATPTIAITYLYGTKAAGLYALANSAVAAPLSFIGRAVADVIYGKLARTVNPDESAIKLIKKTSAILLVIALILTSIISFNSKYLFNLIFGKEWTDASLYITAISIYMVMEISSKPFVAIIPKLKLEGLYLTMEIASISLASVGILLAKEIQNTPQSIALGYNISTSIITFTTCIFIFRKINETTLKKL